MNRGPCISGWAWRLSMLVCVVFAFYWIVKKDGDRAVTSVALACAAWAHARLCFLERRLA